jgi:hypothetical protein
LTGTLRQGVENLGSDRCGGIVVEVETLHYPSF